MNIINKCMWIISVNILVMLLFRQVWIPLFTRGKHRINPFKKKNEIEHIQIGKMKLKKVIITQ